jgi:hypothetical protein
VPPSSAHLMMRYIFTSSSFLVICKPLLPACATRGAGVISTRTHPSIPNTTINVMRPIQQRRTSPLTKANRPQLFTACRVCPNLRHVGFYSHAFQIHHPCLKHELPCSIHSIANQNLRIEHGTHASTPPPASPPKCSYVEH